MSVTSMNSRMAMAEKLSIPQLQQAIKAGSVPAYVGIPLLQEKMKLQRAMQAQMGQEPQAEGTIADQVLQEAEAEGITRLPSNLPLYNTDEMYGEMGDEMGQPEYARGGIVALAEGGDPEDIPAEDFTYTAEGADTAPTTTTVSSTPGAPTQRAPAGQPTLASRLPIPEISPETQALFKEYGDQIRAQRSNAPKDREQALYMALIQGGLAAAGGASPNALQNIAQGATAGFQNYQKAMQDIKKDDRDALKQLLNMGLSKEKFLQEAQKMGVDMYKADRAFDAAAMSSQATLRAAQIRASAEKQPRAITAAEIDQAEINRGAEILQRQNPNMSDNEAKSQAYQNILRIKHPDPSNLTGVGALVGAEHTAIVNDPAVIAAADELKMATYQKDPEAIQKAQEKLDKAKTNASDKFKERLQFIGGISNRPIGATGATGATGAGTTGGGSATGATGAAPTYIKGQVYRDKNGNKATYGGKDASGKDIWK